MDGAAQLSDAECYGGLGFGNLGLVHADEVPIHGRRNSLNLTLPPLSLLVFGRAPSDSGSESHHDERRNGFAGQATEGVEVVRP